MTVSEVQERNPLAGGPGGVVGAELTDYTTLVAEPASMVIFGITGDLSRKKLIPAIYDLAHSGQLPPDFDLVGFARDSTDADTRLREAVIAHARTPFDPVVWAELAERIHLVQGSFDDTAAFARLSARLAELDVRRGKPGNYVFYLSIPPLAFATVCDQLAITGLNRNAHGWRRVVVEKPFGHDLASSQALGVALERVFPPSSIYRIDHYLGKETVQNILALRFANGMFEPLWNNRHIDHVQITMAESVGVTGRAGYYDGVGAARDVIQNHLLQLLALIAMEEPVGFDADSIAAEKIKVLSAAELLGPLAETSARGQYGAGVENGVPVPGLADETGFPADSATETFAALTVGIATRRWAGVPFFIRTGKRLARRTTEIAVTFTPPAHGSPAARAAAVSNVLVFRVQPDDGIELHIGAKRPGGGMHIQPVSLGMDFRSVFDPAPEAYERLICDVLRGDATLFPRREEVEWSWRVIDPLLEHWAATGRPDTYPSGASGPESAEQILSRTGRTWRPL
ncbi:MULTISPECIES: glucose-6-phosphate dehydrogenase [unclassified Rhodococcus (in: high G+C Gram-positive bacteria)]|uniref:glucose-6-phosphate dehydrogenase n=1 Tax=unclassified Rhodococcus (in: high G+C Gram-positive bacteria) TaxID=192944 RepID=UPI00163A1809|nr:MULTISPECIES: glucose-6-phosphate dehydrogenase [unclassified Rhodococcus (in: high G+C Gram-positive bacteria)]MBC2644663.1 glucose-6-phosphate dehydrogenase [Rhodococcus sp. 3A]MBC2898261.1 glucose-6-phosphate dehydrogenase [Rhodococcus sp. 4CII]